jgi:hypothetical protein
MGQTVRMYFIQDIPYTFDELPQLIQDHPSVQSEALLGKDWDDEELYRTSSYLMAEECHPLVFDIQVDNPQLLPQDD